MNKITQNIKKKFTLPPVQCSWWYTYIYIYICVYTHISLIQNESLQFLFSELINSKWIFTILIFWAFIIIIFNVHITINSLSTQWRFFLTCPPPPFIWHTGVWTPGFELPRQALYHLSLVPAFLCVGHFRDRFLSTVCPAWPWTAVFLISNSQVARITGKSQWCLAKHAPI
jgi:hypothetical protein